MLIYPSDFTFVKLVKRPKHFFAHRKHTVFFFKYFFGGFFLFFPYNIQHCFICRPSDSTVPTDAGIEPRTVATCALAVRRSNHQARSHPHTDFTGQTKCKTQIEALQKSLVIIKICSSVQYKTHSCALKRSFYNNKVQVFYTHFYDVRSLLIFCVPTKACACMHFK